MVHPYFNFLVGMVGLSLAFSSCKGSEPELNDSENNCRISFGMQVSRGPVTDVASMTDFKVWGWAHKEKVSTNLFDATKVGTMGQYEGERYWMDGYVHDFFAVHPFALDGVKVTSQGKVTAAYDGSAVGKDAVDLMTAANKGIAYTYDASVRPAPVGLSFSHELAKVDVVVKAEEEVTLAAKLFGVVHEGNLTKEYVGEPAVWTSSWVLSAANTEINSPFNRAASKMTAVTGTGQGMPLLNGSLLLPPQGLVASSAGSRGSAIWLSYQYADGTLLEKYVNLLSGNGVANWEAGKSYRYTISIPKNTVEVDITVSVTDWYDKDISTTL